MRRVIPLCFLLISTAATAQDEAELKLKACFRLADELFSQGMSLLPLFEQQGWAGVYHRERIEEELRQDRQSCVNAHRNDAHGIRLLMGAWRDR